MPTGIDVEGIMPTEIGVEEEEDMIVTTIRALVPLLPTRKQISNTKTRTKSQR